MKLINSINEITKYNEKDIFNLFDDLNTFIIKINKFEDIIYIEQNNNYPLKYRIIHPTKKVLEFFKTKSNIKSQSQQALKIIGE